MERQPFTWNAPGWYGGWRVVLKRDPCVYCYGASDTVEHVRPRANRKHRGMEELDNIVGACRHCNQDKGAMPLLIFLALRVLRADVPVNEARKRKKLPTWGRILRRARGVWPLDLDSVRRERH